MFLTGRVFSKEIICFDNTVTYKIRGNMCRASHLTKPLLSVPIQILRKDLTLTYNYQTELFAVSKTVVDGAPTKKEKLNKPAPVVPAR